MARALTSFTDAKRWHPQVDQDELRIAWGAAEGYVRGRVSWDAEPPAIVPAPLQQAVKLMTARLLQRSKSPDGVVGMDADGLGAVRVPRTDVDVIALIAPYRPVVFG